MFMLGERSWVPVGSERYVQTTAQRIAAQDADATEREIRDLIRENRVIHEEECVNLNPATNAMNPKAEALLASGLGSRPSLGYPGDKYEMGLEAVEKIEIIAAQLAAEVFGARFAEIRVPSGAIANLYVFMATAKPGDTIIAPAAVDRRARHPSRGRRRRHVRRRHASGAGRCRQRYTVDVDALRADARRLRPEADHDRRQPQPVPAPDPRAPADRRRGRSATCCSTPPTCAA